MNENPSLMKSGRGWNHSFPTSCSTDNHSPLIQTHSFTLSLHGIVYCISSAGWKRQRIVIKKPSMRRGNDTSDMNQNSAEERLKLSSTTKTGIKNELPVIANWWWPGASFIIIFSSLLVVDDLAHRVRKTSHLHLLKPSVPIYKRIYWWVVLADKCNKYLQEGHLLLFESLDHSKVAHL